MWRPEVSIYHLSTLSKHIFFSARLSSLALFFIFAFSFFTSFATSLLYSLPKGRFSQMPSLTSPLLLSSSLVITINITSIHSLYLRFSLRFLKYRFLRWFITFKAIILNKESTWIASPLVDQLFVSSSQITSALQLQLFSMLQCLRATSITWPELNLPLASFVIRYWFSRFTSPLFSNISFSIRQACSRWLHFK